MLDDSLKNSMLELVKLVYGADALKVDTITKRA